MTNSEICAMVRGLPRDIKFVDDYLTTTDLKRFCASYERLLAAAKGVEQQAWGEEDCAMAELKAAIEEAEW